MRVRDATTEDHLSVMRVLDGAMLDVDAETVARRIEAGSVLVADGEGTVVGALVLDDSHVDAVAVTRSRRGQGVGSALVEAAGRRVTRLTADFDPRVRPFYESLGFAVEERDSRLWGVRE